MKIGLLVAGHVPDVLVAEFGTYGDMFKDFLGGQGFDFDVYDVVDGVFPANAEAADGWLVTGSKHGVYDPLPFIPVLMEFIAEIARSGRPMVGICFGHQAIAHALGGKAEKFDKGWAVGRTVYDTPEGSLTLYGYHQDQVTQKPPQAEVIASTAFCPYAGLQYGDHILTLQPHPEFDAAYVEALLTTRAVGVVPEDVVETARASLTEGATDGRATADRIARFFHAARVQRA
ncbi:glutamine amidotransferase-related protein [Pseudaestuariivita sp.]|uniref:glutamine amidotransferase-related protein n=1 Tax=Pseudaestuariivita sp. TaxID=2211669 RepID=UPI004058ADEA